MRDTLDTQIKGQMSIDDLMEPKDRLVAVSRIFARARKNMSLSEQKTFIYALSQIKFKQSFPDNNIIYIDKKKLAEIVGINSDEDHLSVDLNRSIGELPRNSFIKIADEDAKLYDNGNIITRVTMLKNRVRIKFEEEYLQLFSNLGTNYITLWSSDIFGMQSKRSVQFYEYLRQYTDSRKDVNTVVVGVKAFKEMFSIPKDGSGSYMRRDGHFDRPSFEKYVIQPLCDDLKECRMINLLMQDDGKYYVKQKRGNLVDGYRFFWTFTKYPAVASASEVKELQEQVDENPQILKVAKDIVKGKSRAKSASKNMFHNFEERQVDYDSIIEKRILERNSGKNQYKDSELEGSNV